MWDPRQYALFASHRARPFTELLTRVDATDPDVVVDLGCGDGPLTLGLADRWPGARVIGVDSSPTMLATARNHDVDGRVEWVEADVQTWDPATLGSPVDVLVSNALLQWVPGHLDLLPRWVDGLAPEGWFAMQVPDNFGSPTHRLMREAAARHPRAADLGARLDRARAVHTPAEYLATLAQLGLEVDAWSTTYQHVLDPAGAHRSPVLEWVRGTGLRPVLEVLTDDAERTAFLEDYTAELDRAYPRHPWGTVMEFTRTFVVARRPVAPAT